MPSLTDANGTEAMVWGVTMTVMALVLFHMALKLPAKV